MKALNLFLAFIALLVSACSISSVQSESELRSIGNGNVEVLVPSSLKILAINGNKVDSPSLHEGQYRLLLEEGPQRIIVQYEENWNSRDEIGNIILWEPVAIENEFSAGQRYVLTHAPVREKDQAEALIKAPAVWLIGAKQKITGQLVKGEKSTMQYLPVDKDGQVSRLQQLKAMWQDAQPEEREAFANWIRQQQ